MNGAVNVKEKTANVAAMYALCVGLVVLPLYSPQVLAPLLVPDLGLDGVAAGAFPMLSLAGYALGLLLLVPLADVAENRRLVCTILFTGAVVLGGAATAGSALVYGAMVFAAGACCSGIQILVPMAVHRVHEAERGRVIGTVMSGLMMGILCSRPLASIAAQHFGWRTVFVVHAVLFGLCTATLYLCLPTRRPAAAVGYVGLIGSMWRLVKTEPVLRRRALSQALCMMAFSLFWTAVPFRLQQAPFALGGDGIGLFALAGAAGVIVAPVAGRIGDSGRTAAGTRAAHVAIVVAAILAAACGGSGAWPHAHPAVALAGMAVAAFVIDLGVIGDQALGRRLVNLLDAAARARLNGLYTGLFFIGGALGAAASGPVSSRFGWNGVCAACAVVAVAALFVNRRGMAADLP